MKKAGILMHIRHLETVEWERLVWGVPAEDSIGSLPMVVELLLNEPKCMPYSVIIFGCGPSNKDGMTEGAYTKKYLLDHLEDLRKFPRFAKRLDDAALNELRSRLNTIIVTKTFTRSVDEIAIAAQIFDNEQITQVTQVAAASHAPRCVQLQSAARAAGQIPESQHWSLVADDRYYEDADAFSTVVFEPPHRADDPMKSAPARITDSLRDYHYGLSPEHKKELIAYLDAYMKQHARSANAHTIPQPNPALQPE